MGRYFIKESFNDDIPASVFKVYKRRLFGLLPPKFLEWFWYSNDAKTYIKKLTNYKE